MQHQRSHPRRRRKKKSAAKHKPSRWRTKRPSTETLPFHPLQFFRPGRICQLLDIDKSTLSRWRKQGVLPPFTKVAGIEGLTGEQLKTFLGQHAGSEQ